MWEGWKRARWSSQSLDALSDEPLAPPTDRVRVDGFRPGNLGVLLSARGSEDHTSTDGERCVPGVGGPLQARPPLAPERPPDPPPPAPRAARGHTRARVVPPLQDRSRARGARPAPEP